MVHEAFCLFQPQAINQLLLTKRTQSGNGEYLSQSSVKQARAMRTGQEPYLTTYLPYLLWLTAVKMQPLFQYIASSCLLNLVFQRGINIRFQVRLFILLQCFMLYRFNLLIPFRPFH